MAARKITTKKTTKKAAPVRKAASPRKTSRSTSLMDYFRLGESYTSLVLGIIVVIAIAVLLVSFFKTRTNSSHIDNQQGTTSISTIAEHLEKVTPTSFPSITEAPTASPTPTSAPIPTRVPTATVTPTSTPVPTQVAPSNKPGTVTYRIKAGDDLWKIAEEQYHDGYQWVAIAKANNLSNPSIINIGNILILPKVTPSPTISSAKSAQSEVAQSSKINGTSYVIMHGDDLWDISVRAYGNGYKWVDIAKANNLSSPNLIHVGNSLKIPR
jgi:putative chitinase